MLKASSCGVYGLHLFLLCFAPGCLISVLLSLFVIVRLLVSFCVLYVLVVMAAKIARFCWYCYHSQYAHNPDKIANINLPQLDPTIVNFLRMQKLMDYKIVQSIKLSPYITF